MPDMVPWKYQRQAVEHFIDPARGNMRVVIADEMGLGKTGEALLSWKAAGLPGPCILLGRVNALAAFKRQCAHWGVPLPIMVRGRRPQRVDRWNDLNKAMMALKRKEIKPEDLRGLFYATTREALKKDIHAKLVNPEWFRFIIVDEAHRDANNKTGNFRLVKALARHGTWPQMPGVCLLTGTPKGHRHTWGLLNLVRPRQYSSYWNFMEKYYYIDKKGAFGWEILAIKDEQVFQRELAASGAWLRRMKKDVKPDMPPKIRDIDSNVLEMSKVQVKMYNELLEDGMMEISSNLADGHSKDLVITSGIMTKITRLRQTLLCPMILDPGCGDYGAAIERLVDMLEEAEDHHMVIFVPYTAAIPYIIQAIKAAEVTTAPILEFSGGRFKTADELLWAVGQFQKMRGIAISSISFAESFDLTPATWAVFLGFDWSADANLQAEDRLHRGDLQCAVNYYYFRYREGVDTELMLAALDKRVNEHQALHKGFDAVYNMFKRRVTGDTDA